MADHDDGNVVEFRRPESSDAERLASLGRAPVPSCGHRRKRIVDEKQRTVQCGECGAWLDPIWCLLTLIDYREALERERRAIEFDKRQAAERQQRAIARRQREATKKAGQVVAKNCAACGGSGWRRTTVRGPRGQIAPGVEKCTCRKGGARLIE